jgi:hypothetical protein
VDESSFVVSLNSDELIAPVLSFPDAAIRIEEKRLDNFPMTPATNRRHQNRVGRRLDIAFRG